MTRTELETFLEKRFGHLGEADRRKATTDFGARNICDLSTLLSKAKNGPLSAEEIERLEETRDFEEACENEIAVDMANEVLRAQRTENTGRGGIPRTVREFESFLRDAGFSGREARRIASEGFEGR